MNSMNQLTIRSFTASMPAITFCLLLLSFDGCSSGYLADVGASFRFCLMARLRWEGRMR